MNKHPQIWSLYIIRTVTQTLYSGITTDLERRFYQHQSNKGAKYLKGKGPLCLVYQVVVGDKSKALKLEYRLKQLAKQKKEQLVRDQPDLITLEEDLLC